MIRKFDETPGVFFFLSNKKMKSFMAHMSKLQFYFYSNITIGQILCLWMISGYVTPKYSFLEFFCYFIGHVTHSRHIHAIDQASIFFLVFG